MNILFFGSTEDSVIVLNSIHGSTAGVHTLNVCAVVTQPPRPFGRKKTITPTPVQLWAQSHTVPFLSFASGTEKSWEYENEETVITTLQPFQADLILSASYGQKIPSKTIADAKYGGLNIHPSLLPRWRGADPVPWAIIAGDHQTGVTIVTLSEAFDQGKLVCQKKLSITHEDTSDPLRTKLFEMGAKMFVETLEQWKGDPFEDTVKNQEKSSYARKFHKQDGYLPWELLQESMQKEPGSMSLDAWKLILQQYPDVKLFEDYIKHAQGDDPSLPLGTIFERFFRALNPWPGIWTTIGIKNPNNGTKEERRVKILECHLSPTSLLVLDRVQLEGKNPVSFDQFKSVYL